MKTVQAKLIKKNGSSTENQMVVDLVLSHIESFMFVRISKVIYAYTVNGNVYLIKSKEGLEIMGDYFS